MGKECYLVLNAHGIRIISNNLTVCVTGGGGGGGVEVGGEEVDLPFRFLEMNFI